VQKEKREVSCLSVPSSEKKESLKAGKIKRGGFLPCGGNVSYLQKHRNYSTGRSREKIEPIKTFFRGTKGGKHRVGWVGGGGGGGGLSAEVTSTTDDSRGVHTREWKKGTLTV